MIFLKINFGRIVLLFPIIVLFLLLELDLDHLNIHMAAGQVKHILIGIVFLIIVLKGYEVLFSRLLGVKIADSLRSYFLHIIAPVYLFWSLILTLFVFQVGSRYTDYGIWSNGINKVNTVLYKLTPSKVERTKNDLKSSLEIAGGFEDKSILSYTQGREKKFSKAIECFQMQRVQDKP